jgi:hypothetical protein
MIAYDVTLGPEKPFADGHTATNCYSLADAQRWADNLMGFGIMDIHCPDFHCPLRIWEASDTKSGGPPYVRCVSVIHRELETEGVPK